MSATRSPSGARPPRAGARPRSRPRGRHQRRRLHPLAIAALVIAAIAAITFYAFNRGVPFVHQFTMNAIVTNSVNVRGGDPVRIGGINVGQVASVTADGTESQIELTLQRSALPIHKRRDDRDPRPAVPGGELLPPARSRHRGGAPAPGRGDAPGLADVEPGAVLPAAVDVRPADTRKPDRLLQPARAGLRRVFRRDALRQRRGRPEVRCPAAAAAAGRHRGPHPRLRRHDAGRRGPAAQLLGERRRHARLELGAACRPRAEPGHHLDGVDVLGRLARADGDRAGRDAARRAGVADAR